MKYGFLGCGNMGSAIARAVSNITQDIMITDRSGKAKSVAQELNIIYSDAKTIAMECDRIFLAVKPQMMQTALAPVTEILRARKPVLITMAAGLEMQRFEEFLGARLPIIRIMPNTPVSIGKGMTVYCYNDLIEADILEDFISDMQYTGKMDEISESLIDAASALSGSGPAYMYMFLDALSDGAVSCGMPRKKAVEYAALTMLGAAEMVLQSGDHPCALKDAVCSPAGSTIEGVKKLEANGFRSAVIECVSAAYQKNKALNK